MNNGEEVQAKFFMIEPTDGKTTPVTVTLVTNQLLVTRKFGDKISLPILPLSIKPFFPTTLQL